MYAGFESPIPANNNTKKPEKKAKCATSPGIDKDFRACTFRHECNDSSPGLVD